MSHFQEFMYATLKLRMNLPNEFISFLFHVSPATTSIYFEMAQKEGHEIIWSDMLARMLCSHHLVRRLQ